MLTSLSLQIALALGVSLAFVLQWVVVPRRVTGGWALFWVLRLAGSMLALRLIGEVQADRSVSAVQAFIAGALLCAAQFALIDAIWEHATPHPYWQRWRRVAALGTFVYAIGPLTILFYPDYARYSVGVATAAFRFAAVPWFAVDFAVIWCARGRLPRATSTLLLVGLGFQAASNLVSAVLGLSTIGTSQSLTVPAVGLTVQLLAVVTLAFGGLYAVLAEERDRVHRLAEEHERARHLESLGRMASGVAHDFNNVLGAIQLTAEAALEDPDTEAAREELAMLDDAVSRGAALVQSLESYAQPAPLLPGTVNVHGALTELAPMLRRLLGASRALAIQANAEHADVRIDEEQLGRVLTNFVTNARDATPDGGAVTISTATIPAPVPAERRAGTRWLRLSVHDTGSGIPAHVLPNIFEPFYTTKEPGRGTGLGLALAHSFVTQHGGRVLVDSSPLRGTTFHVDLPLAPARSEA